MKTGEKVYKSSKMYKDLRQILLEEYDVNVVDDIYDEAALKLDAFLIEYRDIPQGEHYHTDSIIFPKAAMYLAMKEKIGEDALVIIEEFGKEYAMRIGKKLASITKTRFMSKVFMKIFGHMSKSKFGNANGFEQKFYEGNSAKVQFDILQCPYKKYFALCGCSEISSFSCDSDVYCYGNLPHVEFKRTETLSKGGNRCDFELEYKNER